MFDIGQQTISGENFIELREFVQYKWGSDGLDEYTKEIDLDDIQEMRTYPFSAYIDSIQKLLEMFGDEAVAYEIGFYKGKRIGKSISDIRDRVETLLRIESSWNDDNNFGEVITAKRTEDRTSVIIWRYESHPLYCERMRGFFHGLVSGGRKESCSVDEIRCVCKGGEACEFLITINK